ncbi:protein MobC [Desulfovibrio sp. ZJ369]|uniref:protein MobC n=1 Tax=Desulfovibrio sp. ZJ369 TaxID=2709793 RepID=UPI001F14AF58|nr:protein MobC [Desulfovibrio sp. ZJ369]
MSITASQLKEIRQEFAHLKPAVVTLDGNRAMTVKQAIFALAPTLERMKKRGFDTQELVEKLREKGIEVKAQTLTKYLTEARRLKESGKAKRQDTPPPASTTAKAPAIPPSPAQNNDRPRPLWGPNLPPDHLKDHR